MSNFCEPVKILSKGWERIEFPALFRESPPLWGDTPGIPIMAKIPSDTLLDELIRIPQPTESTPFQLGKYQEIFLSQTYDYENQKLLRDYSNNLIYQLNLNRSSGIQADTNNVFVSDFCARIGVCFKFMEYCFLVNNYCRNILTIIPHDRKNKASLITALDARYSACKTQQNFHEVNSQHADFKEREYHERSKKSLDPLRARFSEFFPAEVNIKQFVRTIVSSGEIERYNSSILEDAANNNSEIRKYTTDKGALPRLQQCLFCYRFTLATGKFTRTCLGGECAKAERNWKALLTRRGRSPEDYGFF
jgi:hypothetical protein